jgi:hypothetical protein
MIKVKNCGEKISYHMQLTKSSNYKKIEKISAKHLPKEKLYDPN